MAQVIQEIEVQDILATNLISVESLGNMRKGDLIVVNNASQSVAFRSGASGQFLVMDSGVAEGLVWRDASQALGFIAQNSGDILYSPDGETFTILPPGTSGQVLTIDPSTGLPAWLDVGSTVAASGAVIFTLNPNAIAAPRQAQRTFAYWVWNNSEYGASGMNLTNGELVFHAVVNGTSNVIDFEYEVGDVPTTSQLFPTYGVGAAQEGGNVVAITTPDSSNSAVFALKAQRTSGNNFADLYGFQLHFKNQSVPVL